MTVQSKLAGRLSAYARLCRYPRQIGTVLLVVPYYWGALLYAPTLATAATHSLLLTYGGFMARSAGCALNDFWDQPYDGRVQRTKHRPVASGEVSRAEAVGVALAHALLGSAIFLFLPVGTFELGWALGIAGCLYPLAKRMTTYPQLVLSPFMNAPFIIACYIYGEGVSASSSAYFGALLAWTIIYDTVYAFQDVRDDQRLGIGSTAVRWVQSPLTPLRRLLAATGCFLAVGAAVEGLHPASWAVLSGAVWQVRRDLLEVDFASPKSCGEFFARSYKFMLLVCLGLLISRCLHKKKAERGRTGQTLHAGTQSMLTH